MVLDPLDATAVEVLGEGLRALVKAGKQGSRKGRGVPLLSCGGTAGNDRRVRCRPLHVILWVKNAEVQGNLCPVH